MTSLELPDERENKGREESHDFLPYFEAVNPTHSCSFRGVIRLDKVIDNFSHIRQFL